MSAPWDFFHSHEPGEPCSDRCLGNLPGQVSQGAPGQSVSVQHNHSARDGCNSGCVIMAGGGGFSGSVPAIGGGGGGGTGNTQIIPAAHLMIVDPDADGYDDIFARCCGINWRSLVTTGLITARPDLVTCPGRPNRPTED